MLLYILIMLYSLLLAYSRQVFCLDQPRGVSALQYDLRTYRLYAKPVGMGDLAGSFLALLTLIRLSEKEEVKA